MKRLTFLFILVLALALNALASDPNQRFSTVRASGDIATSASLRAVTGVNTGAGAGTQRIDANGVGVFTGLAVDTNTIKVDATNNRVGINITAPAYALDVLGQANAESATFPVGRYVRTTTATGGSFGTITPGIASGNFLLTKTSGDMTDGFGGGLTFGLHDATSQPADASSVVARLYAVRDGGDTAGALEFGTGSSGSGAWTIMRATGWWGFGVMAPAARIHQDAGTATATYHKFTANATTGQTSTDGFDVGIDSSGNAELRQRENLPMTIFTNNTARMAITADGNLATTGTIAATGAISGSNIPASGYTAGGAAYGSGTALAVTAAGTSGQVLQSAGASAPAWKTRVLDADSVKHGTDSNSGAQILKTSSNLSTVLTATNDSLSLDAGGKIAYRATGDAAVFLYWVNGGTDTLLGVVESASGGALDWQFRVVAMRAGNSSAKITVTADQTGAAAGRVISYNVYSVDFTAAQYIKITGSNSTGLTDGVYVGMFRILVN